MLIVISTQHLFIPTAPLFALLANVTQAITGYRPESVICGQAIKVYLSFKQDTPIMCGSDLMGANTHAGDEYEYLDLEKLVVAALFAPSPQFQWTGQSNAPPTSMACPSPPLLIVS